MFRTNFRVSRQGGHSCSQACCNIFILLYIYICISNIYIYIYLIFIVYTIHLHRFDIKLKFYLKRLARPSAYVAQERSQAIELLGVSGYLCTPCFFGRMECHSVGKWLIMVNNDGIIMVNSG